MGQIRAVERSPDPILQLFHQTSALAIYQVFILFLGPGDTSKVAVIYWAKLLPILLANFGGVKEVDARLIEMARTFGAPRLTVFRRIVLPASVPAIFLATTALLLLIAAEMIGANKGPGFLVMNTQYNFQIPLMFGAIFLLAALGLNAHKLATALGCIDGTGITIENVSYAQGGPASLVALAGGSVELGSAASPAVRNSIAAGNDFVAAYPSNGINDDVQSIFCVLEDSPIKSIKDIAGKTVAVNTLGAHLDYAVREGLHQAGLPEDAANLIAVPGPQLQQVLRSKQVDVSAFGYWQTTFEGAARQTGGIRAIFGDSDVLGEIAGGFIVLRRDWTLAHPEAAKAFVDGSVKALDDAREHPEETEAILARVLAERDENPEVAKFFRGYGVRAGGLAVDRDVQFWIDVLERQGKVPAGKLVAKNILYTTGDSPATNRGTAMGVAEITRRGGATIRDLSGSFALNGQRLNVLRNLNLGVGNGECLAIVGPSGCGKTTLLRILAGLEEPDTGSVLIDGIPVHGVGTARAFIFQKPRLLPWLTVPGNVAFGLEVRGTRNGEACSRARHYIGRIGLGEFEAACQRQLSGGMAQRVGIARALTVQPEIPLLDEPLGALDAMTKLTMQEELARIWREEQVPMVLVTRDLEEAIYLADRFLVLPKGKGAIPRVIDIRLPRPRDRSEGDFVAVRRNLMAEFGLH